MVTRVFPEVHSLTSALYDICVIQVNIKIHVLTGVSPVVGHDVAGPIGNTVNRCAAAKFTLNVRTAPLVDTDAGKFNTLQNLTALHRP